MKMNFNVEKRFSDINDSVVVEKQLWPSPTLINCLTVDPAQQTNTCSKSAIETLRVRCEISLKLTVNIFKWPLKTPKQSQLCLFVYW